MKHKEEVVNVFHNNGTKLLEARFVNNVLDGFYATWYEDGTQEMEKHYINGKKCLASTRYERTFEK